VLLGPLTGAVVSGCIGLLNAVLADQGLGDVKLAAVIGAWTAHLGVLPWITGTLLCQLLMIAAISGNQLRRRWAGLPPDYTPLGPSLAGGAILAVAAAGLAF
jgi:Flp pilus assembly protein protease CpaA